MSECDSCACACLSDAPGSVKCDTNASVCTQFVGREEARKLRQGEGVTAVRQEPSSVGGVSAQVCVCVCVCVCVSVGVLTSYDRSQLGLSESARHICWSMERVRASAEGWMPVLIILMKICKYLLFYYYIKRPKIYQYLL